MSILTRNLDGVDIPLTTEELAAFATRQIEYEAGAGERLKVAILNATQARLDAFARERNYDGIMSACTYATSTVPQFAAEGQRCVELRDQTWAMLYQMLAEVETGHRPVPASFDDVKGALPDLTWPA